MEKARSLLEADANLDDMEAEPLPRADLQHPSQHHPSSSGFVPASASQSGFSPAGTARNDSSQVDSRSGEPSALPPRVTESGVFAGLQGASGERLIDSVQSALGAASRSEAGLGSLQRAIRDASRAFTASRQAQEALTEELRVLHRGLNELMSEKAAVERYAALLTRERDAALDAAEEARREAKREREFLLREQDRFIQLLLEEHEAELQQLRRSLNQERAANAAGAEAARVDVAPTTVPGVAPTALDQPVVESLGTPPGEPAEGRRSTPPGEPLERQSSPPGELGERRSSPPGDGGERRSGPPGELTGAALARYALGHTPEPVRAVPLPEGHAAGGDAPADIEARSPTYPPAPAVLDLESLAAEVDGNSERPPPIRRVGAAEPVLHLKPARVPTQLYDTLVSPLGEPDPNRKDG